MKGHHLPEGNVFSGDTAARLDQPPLFYSLQSGTPKRLLQTGLPRVHPPPMGSLGLQQWGWVEALGGCRSLPSPGSLGEGAQPA